MVAASWKTPSGPSGEAHTVSKPSAVRERSGAFDWPARLPKTLLAPIKSGWGPLCCCAWNASPGLRVEGHLVRFLVSGKNYTPTISEELRKQRFCPTQDPAPTYSRPRFGPPALQVCSALLGYLGRAGGFHTLVHTLQRRDSTRVDIYTLKSQSYQSPRLMPAATSRGCLLG